MVFSFSERGRYKLDDIDVIRLKRNFSGRQEDFSERNGEFKFESGKLADLVIIRSTIFELQRLDLEKHKKSAIFMFSKFS